MLDENWKFLNMPAIMTTVRPGKNQFTRASGTDIVLNFVLVALSIVPESSYVQYLLCSYFRNVGGVLVGSDKARMSCYDTYNGTTINLSLHGEDSSFCEHSLGSSRADAPAGR